ncbi:NIL domain-containing protein [Geminocystis sp. NIES-3709]|uniref:NIL domain-containing protein n=1 Tax=Geminocystis sp. NIES-3709 TaxID=1617448 RepID=UPI0005FC983B|nr:NIL domain-containing protein [Geminocystis sp. NIES-3709]BAQ66885.1 ferredoxin [Geminocystis sp. NIES-3709]
MATDTLNKEIKSLKISLHIPPKYLQTPIIFDLASNYDLEVNITSALLGEYGEGDGWFNLVLKGTEISLKNALNYLSDLDIEVWTNNQKGQTLMKNWDFEGWTLEG